MPDLYTSLTRFKQAMNGGILPPMTPIPEKVRHIIDPAFTPGMGAVEEHPEKGLRCFVRGCGGFYHALGHHMATTHRNLGGPRALKELIEIPISTPLVTEAHRGVLRKNGGRCCNPVARERALRAARKPRRPRKGRRITAGERNFKNRCMAQMTHTLLDLRNDIGRVPSCGDATAKLGSGWVNAGIALFGTWNNLMGHAGLPTRKKDGWVETSDVLAGLSAWYDAYGSLPSVRQMKRNNKAPLLHGRRPTLRVLGAGTWPEAMRIAASMLDIHGGRYGLPVKKESAA